MMTNRMDVASMATPAEANLEHLSAIATHAMDDAQESPYVRIAALSMLFVGEAAVTLEAGLDEIDASLCELDEIKKVNGRWTAKERDLHNRLSGAYWQQATIVTGLCRVLDIVDAEEN